MSKTVTYQTLMLQIQDTLVTLDMAERFFLCDLDKCLGQCCIDGDAGAPITPEEDRRLREILPAVKPYILPAALREIEENGVSYIDEEGDLVTQIVDGRNCVFTTYGPDGMCMCAIEKAFRDGKIDFYKPISCHLYPVRIKEYDGFTAINLHRWKICRCAEVLGREKGVRAYQFLKTPLIRRFGQEWYDDLALTCEEYLRQNPGK